MERIWLKSYPPGVPADIDPNQYRSLVELFDASIRQYAERPSYHSMGKTISFAELDVLSRQFAAWLQARGLGKGARVAIMLPNVPQAVIAYYGTLKIGAVVVQVNPLYVEREIEQQVRALRRREREGRLRARALQQAAVAADDDHRRSVAPRELVDARVGPVQQPHAARPAADARRSCEWPCSLRGAGQRTV